MAQGNLFDLAAVFSQMQGNPLAGAGNIFANLSQRQQADEQQLDAQSKLQALIGTPSFEQAGPFQQGEVAPGQPGPNIGGTGFAGQTGMQQPQVDLLQQLGAVSPETVLQGLAGQILPGQQGKGFKLSPGQTQFDAAGNIIAQLPGDTSKLNDKQFGQLSKLRGEFSKRTAAFGLQNDAFGRIQASAQNPSAAGDLALIFNYMKLLDPGSTVREGEFANAQNAGGVEDRTRALWGNLLQGTRLTPKQRKDFTDRAKGLYVGAVSTNEKRKKETERLASKQGLDPSLSTFGRDLFVTDRKTIKNKDFILVDNEWFEL